MADFEDLGFQSESGSFDDLGFMSDAPASPTQGAGFVDYLTTRDLGNAAPYDPLAQAARLGQFANRGNQDLAGIIAEQSGQAAEGLDRVVPGLGTNVRLGGIAAGGAMGTASEFLLPQNRIGVASYLLGPVAKAYQALRGPVTGVRKPGIFAQIGSARTKVAPGDIQQAIDDPSVWDAPSVAAGNKAYGEAAGPLKGVARSLREQTGKVLLGEADYAEAINKPGRILAGTEIAADGSHVQMDPQTALEGIQSINRFTRNKANTAKLDEEQIGELLRQKEELLTFLENNGTAGMREAATVLRKAHVKENLGRIMPQNKFGGTDALRTMGAGATAAAAGSLALAGHPLAALPLAAEALTSSPAFLGGAIRNYQAISNPAVIGAAGAATNALTSYVVKPTNSPISDEYNRLGNR